MSNDRVTLPFLPCSTTPAATELSATATCWANTPAFRLLRNSVTSVGFMVLRLFGLLVLSFVPVYEWHQVGLFVAGAFLDFAVVVKDWFAVYELAPVALVDFVQRALNVHAKHVCYACAGDVLVAD